MRVLSRSVRFGTASTPTYDVWSLVAAATTPGRRSPRPSSSRVAVAIGVVVHNWIALVVVLAAFGVRAAVLSWQARPDRGRVEHWPIGDLRSGPEGITHIDHYSQRSARYGPVFKTNYYERPACCIVDLELAVLRCASTPATSDRRGTHLDGSSPAGASAARTSSATPSSAVSTQARSPPVWSDRGSRRSSGG